MVAPTMARMVLPWIFQILSTTIQESGEGYVMNIDLNFESNRQKKLFMTDPLIYLSKKVNSAEVNYRRLTEDEKQLFENAKNSEVSSFLKTQAVRRCLSFEESQKAQQSDRVLRARWVLTWKGVPEESREEAAMDRENNKESTYTADLSRKAKARIVLLGFQHPDLESPDFRTTSPVQSQLMKHLSLVLCSQRKWKLESLDMKTAFLQTGAADMESKELWTPGVPELRAALGAQDHDLLRILRNVYESMAMQQLHVASGTMWTLHSFDLEDIVLWATTAFGYGLRRTSSLETQLIDSE